jgi:hypothetical protein
MNKPPLSSVALALMAAGALSACYEATFPIYESFEVVVPVFDLAELQENPDGWDFVESSPIQDTEKLMSQLPEQAGSFADIQLLHITLTSPEMGNLGEWLTNISLYVSTDDQLSDDDDLIVHLPELPPNQVQFVIDFPEGTTLQKYVDAGTLAIITTGTLIALPDEEITIPIDVSAEGILGAF